jgi:hypothetical protein
VTAPSSIRSLLPKEHGAYGQLMLPLATALLCARPTAPAFLFAAAAVLAFFAHEPLLVLLGHRGPRALREDGARARLRVVLLAACSLVGAAVALALSDRAARLSLLLPIGGAAIVGIAIWRKQERTDWGEVAAAAALSASSLPVAVAGGVSPRLAVAAWGVWSLGFGLVTLALRRAIHGRKAAKHDAAWTLTLTSLLLCACALIACSTRAMALAAAPTVGFALGLLLVPPAPKRLRRIGWLLVMSSIATGLLLVRALRSGAL